MPLVVKIKYEDETRRISLDKIPTYSDILAIIQPLFPTIPVPFQIKYQDEEDDLITLSSDKELIEAINIASKSQVLRLSLHPRNVAPQGPTSTPTPSSVPPQAQTQTAPQQMPFNPLLASLFNPQLMSQFANLQTNPNAFSSSGQPDLGSLFRSFGNPQSSSSASAQSSTQTSQNVPEHGSANPNVNEQFPFANMIQQFLNNPQMIQGLLTNFLPMITGYLQNATPEQRQKGLQFISTALASNPQLAALAPQLLANNPQLLQVFPELINLVKDIPTQQPNTSTTQAPPNPFASLAQAFSSSAFSQSQSSPFNSGFGEHIPSSSSFSCDICENPITGVRYHCDTCGNFDLCSFCQTIPQVHDVSHKLSELHPQH